MEQGGTEGNRKGKPVETGKKRGRSHRCGGGDGGMGERLSRPPNFSKPWRSAFCLLLYQWQGKTQQIAIN
jgi:hypothetical protein